MSARFLFDSAVVGSAADVSRAKAALRRACGLLREKRTHTDGKNTCGGRSGRTCRRYKRKECAYFYRQIRRQIYVARAYEIRAERQNKEPCARQGRKDRKEVLRTDKNGRGKSKPRVRGKRAHGRERRIVGKQVKINCFCGFFIQKKEIRGKKNAKNGLKKRNAVNLLAKYGQSCYNKRNSCARTARAVR